MSFTKKISILAVFAAMLLFCGHSRAMETRNAFDVIEAEWCEKYLGIEITLKYVGFLDPGDWFAYKNVKFDSSPGFLEININIPLDAKNTIEFRLDSITGRLIANYQPLSTVPTTCEGDACYSCCFQTQKIKLADTVTGMHDVYIVSNLTGLNVNWFRFLNDEFDDVPKKITYPLNGMEFNSPAFIMLSAAGSSDNNTNKYITTFYSNNEKIGQITIPPYSLSYYNDKPGDYNIKIIVTDLSNKELSRDSIKIKIKERPIIDATKRIEGESYSSHRNGTGYTAMPYPTWVPLKAGIYAGYKGLDFGERANYIELEYTVFEEPGVLFGSIDTINTKKKEDLAVFRYFFTPPDYSLERLVVKIPLYEEISGIHDFYFCPKSGYIFIDNFKFGYDSTIIKITKESFAYETGEMDKKGLAKDGWANSWVKESGNIEIVDGNLGNDAVGKSAISKSESGVTKYSRNLSEKWVDDGTPIWVSFFTKKAAFDILSWGGLSLLKEGEEQLFIGSVKEKGMIGLNNVSTTVSDTVLNFITVKLEMYGNTRPDSAFMWVNYIGDKTPNKETAEIKCAWGSDGFDALKIADSSCTMLYDKIRIGKIFEKSGISPIAVTDVKLNATKLSLDLGTSSYLFPTFYPANATSKECYYSSSPEGVVVVNNKGVVTAIAVGDAIITITAIDGGKTATCEVTVNPTGILSSNARNIEIYPNPVKNNLQLSAVADKVVIYTIEGKSIFYGYKCKNIDISNISEGVYLINIYLNDQAYIKKFIKN